MAKEEIEHKKRRYLIIILMALLVAFLAVVMAQNAQDTADINNVFAPFLNNTNLAPQFPGEPTGTGERVSGVTYWANDSPIWLMAFAHAQTAAQTAGVSLFINGTLVEPSSGKPLGAAEEANKSVVGIIPKGANYSISFDNFHHYEWREYPILSGKNGTLSINTSILGNSFNATYDANISALQRNDTYFNGTVFPNSTNFRNNTMFDHFESGKVNKTGDNMTGALHINNGSFATNGELLSIQKEGTGISGSAIIRLETNSSAANVFFGARYRGFMADNATPVQKGDDLFRLTAIGTKVNNTYSGTVSEIRFVATDNFTNTKTPSQIEFWTVANVTTTTLIKRWGIEANGSLIPGSNNNYDIGNDTLKVKNLSISMSPIAATQDAVCFDGTKLFFNTGLATCTVSRSLAKNNITNASYDPVSLQRFQLITYDYVVKYPHVIESEDRVEYTEKTVKRYGLTAEAVEAIDPLLVGHDEFGNPTGIHYEDLAAYLLNVTQAQQIKLDKICARQPSLCQ